MSNPLALAMLKSFIGPEQIEALEKLTQELMRALGTIQEMDARLKRIELCIDPPASSSEADKKEREKIKNVYKDALTSGRGYGIWHGE